MYRSKWIINIHTNYSILFQPRPVNLDCAIHEVTGSCSTNQECVDVSSKCSLNSAFAFRLLGDRDLCKYVNVKTHHVHACTTHTNTHKPVIIIIIHTHNVEILDILYFNDSMWKRIIKL